MTTLIAFHEVKDGNVWANAWKKGPGSRHEQFAKFGVKARNFRDPNNHNNTGVLMDVEDVDGFMAFLNSDEGKQAMTEDGLKVETMRVLAEFTP
jgi:hypothetical protein